MGSTQKRTGLANRAHQAAAVSAMKSNRLGTFCFRTDTKEVLLWLTYVMFAAAMGLSQ